MNVSMETSDHNIIYVFRNLLMMMMKKKKKKKLLSYLRCIIPYSGWLHPTLPCEVHEPSPVVLNTGSAERKYVTIEL